MGAIREWIIRFLATLGRRRDDRDLREELELHLALAAEDAARRCDSTEPLERTIQRQAGGLLRTMEALREQRSLPWIEDFVRDVRYGWHMLANNPGFTVVSVISLAVGIGANCAVFSWADALLLRPLPVPRPSEIITVGSPDTTADSPLRASYREYVDLRSRATSFEGLSAFASTRLASATTPGATPRLTMGLLVSGNFFSVMHIVPSPGRSFRDDEDAVPGRDAVVVLGRDVWERLGASPSIVGRTIWLNTIAFTVIGVAPDGFTGPDQFARYDFFVPLTMWPRLVNGSRVRPLDDPNFRSLTIKGRLKAGVTLGRARTELAAIAAEFERAYPDTNPNRSLLARTELQNRIAQAPPNGMLIAMLTLLAAAVLFVACANVAGLLTSRAPVRAREIAVRLAIGAGRARVVRQLITESALIAALGCILGVAMGYACVTVFRQIQLPTDLAIGLRFELDRRALVVSVIVALGSALASGVWPALRATRTDLTAVMRTPEPSASGRGRTWGRAALVAGQVAISVVLLVLATRIYRGSHEMLGGGPGYRTDHLLLVSFDTALRHFDENQVRQYFNTVTETAARVSGVKSAALTSDLPMDGLNSIGIVPEGFQFPPGRESATVGYAVVDEHYFEALGVPITKGRAFLSSDGATSPVVAVVNERLAQHYWPGQNPIGQRFRTPDDRESVAEIVGVARNSKYSFIMEPPIEFVYFSYRQRPRHSMVLVAESVDDPLALAAPLVDAIHRADPGQPVYNVRTMAEFYRYRVLNLFTVIIGLVATLGLMGLGLSIIGLYGLVAYSASRRTREIGIRMAIGADRDAVLWMVLRQGLSLAVVGLGVGAVTSMGMGRALAAAFPTGPAGRSDYVALPLVTVTVLLVTLIAAYMPARRASEINPTSALRCD